VKVVAFPFHDWRKGDVEGRRWRDAHVIEAIAKMPEVDRILVIDRPVSLAERFFRRQSPWASGTTLAERYSHGTHARIIEVADKIHVLDIHVHDLIAPIILRRGWWFRTFANSSVIDQVRWASRESDMRQPVVFAWTPTVAPAVLALDPSALLFDALDNWLIHPRLRGLAREAAAGYAALLPAANAVVVSAPASREVLQRWAPNIAIIPNGVDPALFRGGHDRPSDLPPRPVVGYAGSLASRVDATLVAGTAAKLPDVTFAFVGPIFDPKSIKQIRGVANVHILGNRHYSRVPAYIEHFDIAWIPHVVGEGETGGDPIKMYEYWAAGREVVATPIDGISKWSSRLHLVRDAGEAAETIAGLLDGTVERKRASVPDDRTWDSIATSMVEMVTANIRS
jgi:teichuronic acid biosynthesis glycosyltransferase TuaH